MKRYPPLTPHVAATAVIILVAGVPRDFCEAKEPEKNPVPVPSIEEIRGKAERGDASAQFDLGNAYLNGDGVDCNWPSAAIWIRKAAEQGLAQAQCSLATTQYYQEGRRVTGDMLKWWRKAAEQGNAAAQYDLGVTYAFGNGVANDVAEALKWNRKAAEQGIAPAQYFLAAAYRYGEGVPKDVVEERKWSRRAADQGLTGEQFSTGLAYHTGKGEVKDEVEAVKWYRKVAEQGWEDAQSELGDAYRDGCGVPKNIIEAYKWFDLSAAAGRAYAKQQRTLLEAKMTPEQIAEAQKLSREFKPRKPTASFDVR